MYIYTYIFRAEDGVEDALVEVYHQYILRITQSTASQPKPVFIAAHSGSAYHAVNLAEKYPNCVKNLVLICGGGFLPSWGPFTVLAAVGKQFLPVLAAISNSTLVCPLCHSVVQLLNMASLSLNYEQWVTLEQ